MVSRNELLEELTQLLVAGKLINMRTTRALSASTDYAAEDVLCDSAATAWEFKNAVETAGGKGYITQARFMCFTTGLSFRPTLYLFDRTPTSQLTDNSANTALLAADLSMYLGKIDSMALEDLGGHSESLVTPSTVGNLPLAFTLSGQDMYGILVTRDAITGEAAGMDMSIVLTVEQQR